MSRINRVLTITCVGFGYGPDRTLEVEGYFEPEIAAFTSGLPENCYPAEGGTFEVISVTEAGKEVLNLPHDFPSDEDLYELASGDESQPESRPEDEDIEDFIDPNEDADGAFLGCDFEDYSSWGHPD
jgi:hypothetical protein